MWCSVNFDVTVCQISRGFHEVLITYNGFGFCFFSYRLQKYITIIVFLFLSRRALPLLMERTRLAIILRQEEARRILPSFSSHVYFFFDR
jgi:hypothetical protein